MKKGFNLKSGLESAGNELSSTESYCRLVLNQRAKRIHVFGLWQEVQFDIWTWKSRTWIITTKSYCKVVLNQRANRIHTFSFWQEVQFEIWTWKCRKWVIINRVILQISFETNSEQDSCVWPVTWGAIWHLDLESPGHESSPQTHTYRDGSGSQIYTEK